MQVLSLANYNIYIGDIWANLQQFLQERNYASIAVIVDDNTAEHCLPLLTQNIDLQQFILIAIPPGEQYKYIGTCKNIWQAMMKQGINRRSLTINLGGGVIGDMGGFCASTFKRGMDFIQLPTTLLSQVDASIGGKLGVDFNHIKNSLGVFNNPKAVFIHPDFLQTLPLREIRSGFAEIIKHSLIADAEQWAAIQKVTDIKTVDWSSYLVPSLKIKQRIVEEDPFEKGIRKALNFGHTIGHAIESVLLDTEAPLLHGEAIAIGMITESYIAHKTVGLPMEELKAITEFILRIYGKMDLNPSDFPAFLHLMTKDKKNEGNEINFTLINPIGKALINQTCSNTLIEESLKYYNEL